MPRMVNPEYLPGEGPNTFLEPGWAARGPEAHVFPEPPEGFADLFSDDDGRVSMLDRDR